MFITDKKSLKEIPFTARIGITFFLVLAGISYLMGFFNILLTYSPVDQKPGLSLKDIEYSFYGKREGTKLEKAIDGGMKEYFADENEYNTTKEWLKAGAGEAEFNSKIKPIFDASCSSCHSAEAQVGQVVTVDYKDLAPLLQMDTGKSIGRLVSISHTHLFATLVVIFLLNMVFFYTAYPDGLKRFVSILSFSAIVLDIGSWWLAKLAPFFAVFVIIGGLTLAISFLLLTVLPLYEIWLKKAK